MTTLQTDLLEIYNSFVIFSKEMLNKSPLPLKITYNEESAALVFELNGKTVYLQVLVYYCLNIKKLKKTSYLLPEDFDYLMKTLEQLINSGNLLKDRICLGPAKYGFDIYLTDIQNFKNGPEILGKFRFVSGTSWIFKKFVKRRYNI